MSLFDALRQHLADETPVALVTVIDGPNVGAKMLIRADGSHDGQLWPDSLTATAARDAGALLRAERSDTMRYDHADGPREIFVDVFPGAPQLIIVGASHAAGPLSTFAAALGYRVIITDARAAFAVPDRYPHAARVVKGWPQDVLPDLRLDENTYVVLLSHDPKFDEPTLHHVLPTPVRYIGAIGSRLTQAQRFERLRSAGFDDSQLSRIYGPVGLDIGSQTPEETAIAILAEITAVRRGKTGGSMRDTVGRDAGAHS
ncbi:MAG TPA: XdhC/CoxI family protein [Chloroflexota bacterium]|nr:XdhC/CoxI family protein [Chloroflexota bacterium]